MKKKPTNNFSKFAKKKSNAAIKEEFRQEKRKIKKEREEYFDKKKAERRGVSPDTAPGRRGDPRAASKDIQPIKFPNPNVGKDEMPLNKFIAHSGIAARREAAEL